MTDARRVQTASTTLTPENSTPEGGEREEGENVKGEKGKVYYITFVVRQAHALQTNQAFCNSGPTI